jgi:hypothetical protein
MSKRKPNGLDAATDITRPPGLLGLLVDHGEQCTPYATRWPALIGVLVGFSAATRNRFALRIGPCNHLALNLYGAEIGDTGRGKETGLRLATAIAQCGGVAPAAFASAEGLHRALAAKPKDSCDPKARILIQDEWGHALQQIKADKAGHQRGVMTKAMECYGLAIGGTLKERSYANAKNDVPAVKNPYLCALFATTPSTLLDALTSAAILDGSLNRIITVFLDNDPALRDLDDIQDVMIPKHLAEMIQRASSIEFESDGERQPGALFPPVKQKTFANLERVELGGQSFKSSRPSPAP